MKMDIDKEMNLYIGEDFFEFTDDRYDGFCFPQDNDIFVRKEIDDIIIHEVIHCFEHDIRTKEAIVKLFKETHNQTLEKFIAHPEIVPIIEDLLDGYDESAHESELYAYLLQYELDSNFKDYFEALSFLFDYIEDNTGVTSFIHIYDYSEAEA